MNKTLHKKLTEKQIYTHTSTLTYGDKDLLLAGHLPEMQILREAAKELLQPRPEAIANILRMSRAM